MINNMGETETAYSPLKKHNTSKPSPNPPKETRSFPTHWKLPHQSQVLAKTLTFGTEGFLRPSFCEFTTF